MQAELRVGQYVDRASENVREKSCPRRVVRVGAGVRRRDQAPPRLVGGQRYASEVLGLAPRALDPPPVVNALRGGRGRARRTTTFLLDSSSPRRRTSPRRSAIALLQTFWSQTDEGAWFEKQEWSLRAWRRTTSARTSRARARARRVPENEVVRRRRGPARAAARGRRARRRRRRRRARRDARRRRRRRAARERRRRRGRRPRRRRRTRSQQLATFSEEAFTLPAALDEMLAELKEYLRSHNVATYRLTSAELVDRTRTRRRARATPDGAARAPARAEEAPGSRGTRCRSSRTSLTTTSAPRTCGRRRRCSRV